MSIYPSAWRDGYCGAHFVPCKDRIQWCDGKEADPPRYEAIHQEAVFAALTDPPKTANEIAGQFDEIPWEVDRAL